MTLRGRGLDLSGILSPARRLRPPSSSSAGRARKLVSLQVRNTSGSRMVGGVCGMRGSAAIRYPGPQHAEQFLPIPVDPTFKDDQRTACPQRLVPAAEHARLVAFGIDLDQLGSMSTLADEVIERGLPDPEAGDLLVLTNLFFHHRVDRAEPGARLREPEFGPSLLVIDREGLDIAHYAIQFAGAGSSRDRLGWVRGTRSGCHGRGTTANDARNSPRYRRIAPAAARIRVS